MKQRTTYILRNGTSFDSSQLGLDKKFLQVDNLDAVKEDRLTFGLAELPGNLQQVLKQCKELRIRWSTSRPYDTVPPFAARMPGGLHVFYEAASQDDDGSNDLLCPALQDAFGHDLACESPQTFVSRSRSNGSNSESLQFWSDVPSLENLISYTKEYLCRSSDEVCLSAVSKLEDAVYFDVDFMAGSELFVLSTVWDTGASEGKWTEVLELRGQQRYEVGVLYEEKAREGADEMSFGGVLAVIGVDEQPKPTLFSLPIQHHSLNQFYNFSFLMPTGLHPTLSLTLTHHPHNSIPQNQNCTLNLYTTLPSTLFLDRYQLADPVLLKQSGLIGLKTLKGATDLEAPTWAVSQWGSVALLQLHHTSTTNTNTINHEMNIKIPMHLRYMPPSSGTNGIRNLSMPWPIIFWACPPFSLSSVDNDDDNIAAAAAVAAAKNPFARHSLGYDYNHNHDTNTDTNTDIPFPPDMRFYHLVPRPRNHINISDKNLSPLAQDDQPTPNMNMNLILDLKVPVLDLDRAGWVESGTTVVVLAATLWILWLLGGIMWREWVDGYEYEYEGRDEGRDEGGSGSESGNENGSEGESENRNDEGNDKSKVTTKTTTKTKVKKR